MLFIIIVPVERFVEGSILNAVHFVTIIGIHGISSFPAVRCVRTGRLFCRSVYPSDNDSIPL